MERQRGYELIDAGGGRRLERFGGRIVDRPATGADEAVRNPEAWAAADLQFWRYAGWTVVAGGDADSWEVDDGDLRFELRPTDTGQVGLFPEQAPNRAWVRDAIVSLGGQTRVLNLFGYTGATTLGAALAGATVTHVDASRPAVSWARRNAELSGLVEKPIRWIVDDVEAYVDREIRRDRGYDAVVLDPPSYGHGGRSATGAWRLEQRLDGLLDRCAHLTGFDPGFVVLTAHTPGFGPDRLADALARAFDRRTREIEAGELGIRALSGARLQLGAYARIMRE